MEDLGKIHQLIVPCFGHDMVFNLEIIVMTWIVILGLICFGFLAARKKIIDYSSFRFDRGCPG